MIWLSFKRRLRIALLDIVDAIAAAMPARARRRSGVLVVRLDAIGDFVLWQSSARHLRSVYPGEHITLATNALCAPLARCLPYWDQIIPVQVVQFQKDPVYRFRQLRAIARAGFDVCVQPTYSRAIQAGDAIVRSSRATVRVGVDGDTANISLAQRRISDTWYTQLLQAGKADITEIEHNTRFAQALAGRPLMAEPYILPNVTSLPERLLFGRPYFIIFPGASWSGRQWSERSFANVLDHTARQFGLSPVLCGSSSESDLCKSIALHASSPTINLAGETSLPEFCELVRGARLLIGNETSAIHIAAAVGTPSVCLLGGGHFGRFVPYPASYTGTPPLAVYEGMSCFGCNWNCHLPFAKGDATPCVAAVEVASVTQAIAQIVGASAQSLN